MVSQLSSNWGISLKTINILYIDDKLDPTISKFLVSICKQSFAEGITTQYDELPFDYNKGYESILNSTIVKAANVVIIDNKLFEESQANAGKFTGKQFKLLLRRQRPYIEVIVLSQFGEEPDNNIIPKFRKQTEDPIQYYNEKLKPEIKRAVSEVLAYNQLALELESSKDIKEELIEKIKLSMSGEEPFSELNSKDIDKLIAIFKEIRENI